MKPKRVKYRSKRSKSKFTRHPYKVGFKFALIFAVLFVIGELMFNFCAWHHFATFAAVGAFLGLLSAPLLEPKHYAEPMLWQAVCGSMAGLLLGIAIALPVEGVLASAFTGLILGAVARWWLKYL